MTISSSFRIHLDLSSGVPPLHGPSIFVPLETTNKIDIFIDLGLSVFVTAVFN